MWSLTTQMWNDGDFGSPELLIGIFWEETMFQNRRQLQGPAIGFGQIEPQIIKQVNEWARKNYSPELILLNDFASVRISVDVLNMLSSRLGSARSVLDGYAGTFYRAVNGVKVTQWLECESILKGGTTFGIGTLNGLSSLDSQTVIDALTAAEPNHRPKVKSVVDI